MRIEIAPRSDATREELETLSESRIVAIVAGEHDFTLELLRPNGLRALLTLAGSFYGTSPLDVTVTLEEEDEE